MAPKVYTPLATSLIFATLAGCASDGSPTGSSVPGALPIGQAASTVKEAAGKVPSLVNVDLSNVLNNLAVNLDLDRANVPINIQLPISLAANVCGVSINVLSASSGAPANCTATTAPQELAQVVQQQMAAGGSVGGGAQGGSTAANSGPTASAAASGSAGDTNVNSSANAGSPTTPAATPTIASPTPPPPTATTP